MAPDDPPTVLLADANARNLELMRTTLREAGVDARAVDDPRDLDRRLESDDPPDLVLLVLDGFPPGIEACCDVARERGIPVVAIAKFRTQELEEWALEVGVRTLLEKPLRKAYLVALTRSLLPDPPGEGDGEADAPGAGA